ncbi:MAG: hypothetical protein PF487_06440 [Bacteroidales bacterium]|jgi:FtsZ-interacting cell division protein ZipA|nr:hypothetical protein [Bacteroidales bacterium]
MDDGIGTILYIAVAIGALVVSAIGKNKKKQERLKMQQKHNVNKYQQSGEDIINENSSNFEDADNSTLISNISQKKKNNLFDEFFETDENRETADNNYEKEKKIAEIEAEEQAAKIEETIEESYDYELGDGYEHEYELGDETEYEDDINLLDEFDLEKAVIYSEIIARKEY